MLKTTGNSSAKNTSIGLNPILGYTNALICIFMWYAYLVNGENQYVNLSTMIWGTVLFAEIGVFLYIEKKRSDPFVIILCFQMVFFYLLRILTLSIYPVSFVFDRFKFEPADLNNAIAFIIVANLSLYLGLYLNKVPSSRQGTIDTFTPKKPHTLFGVILFVYFMTYSPALGIGPLSAVLGLINNLFINVAVVMFMIIIYLVLFNSKLSYLNKTLFISGLLIYVGIATLSGSRSAMIIIAYFFLFSSLAIYGAFKIRSRYLMAVLLALPVLMAFFIVATFLRPRLENRANVNADTFEVLKELDVQQTFSDNSELILSPIFGRIGFLDFGAEIMSNRDKYKQVFSVSYYTKSVIDNVLTPGFDVFDVPKTSNAISFIYNNQGTPKKSGVNSAYQSDEFTIFGEAYAFLGWLSVIPLFFAAFAFKRLYVKIADHNIFLYYVKRGFVLYVFFTFLNSFGLDWLLFDVIGVMFTYLIFRSFFRFTERPALALS